MSATTRVTAIAVLGLLLLAFARAASAEAAAPANIGATKGMCAFYADSLQGKPVASGEKYDKNALTAAHRTLPFGTMVKVTNVKNQKSVVVRINDRGPHGKNKRILDVTRAAAEQLDLIKDGTAEVTIEVVESDAK